MLPRAAWALVILHAPLASPAVLLRRPVPFAGAPSRPAVSAPERAAASPPTGGNAEDEPELANGLPPSFPDVAAGPLRSHQIDARDAACSHFEGGGRRAQVVMPGGSGKTVLALAIAERMLSASRVASPVVIVAVPSIELITQTAREWRRWRQPAQRWVEVAVRSGSESGADAPRPTTDASEIGAELARGAREGQPVIIYSTYNSLHRVAEAMGGRSAELVIFDEAHNTAGRPSKFAAYGLDDDRLAARHRLFLTATPKRYERDAYSGKLSVHSMDDVSVYGPVVYRLG
jgi:predicted helicase